MKYVIMVDYYMYSEEEGEYTESNYLAVDKNKIFYFDRYIIDETKIFKSAEEAGKYVDKHFSDPNSQISFENLRIVQLAL